MARPDQAWRVAPNKSSRDIVQALRRRADTCLVWLSGADGRCRYRLSFQQFFDQSDTVCAASVLCRPEKYKGISVIRIW